MKQVLLGELVEITKGRKPEAIRAMPMTGDVRLLQIEDLRGQSQPRFAPGSGMVVAEESDILLAWDGANAGTSASGLSGVIGSTLARMRPKDRNEVWTPYLAHFVRSERVHLRARAKGATVPHLDPAVVRNLSVGLPSMEEQRRIAAILDRTDALLSQTSRILKELDELESSSYLSAIESVDCWTSLGEVAELRSGVGFPVALQGRPDGDYPVAKVGDIGQADRTNSPVIVSTPNWVTESDLATMRMTPIPPGSVLFAKIGEAIRLNNRAIAGLPLLIDNNAMAAIPREPSLQQFLFAFMKSVDLYPLAAATTVPSLRKSELEKLPFPILSDEQLLVFEAAQVKISKLRDSVASLQDRIYQLYSGLQSQAFSGGL